MGQASMAMQDGREKEKVRHELYALLSEGLNGFGEGMRNSYEEKFLYSEEVSCKAMGLFC